MEDLAPPRTSCAGAQLRAALSQEQLAQLVDVVRTHLARVERGDRTPGRAMTARIARKISADANGFAG